jgi:hypothetical protein
MNAKEQYVFDNAVPITESGCWLWDRSLSAKGYGWATFEGVVRRAHRLSFEAFRGLIPRGMLVCHRCDVRSCVNPEHLFLGTAKDNALDAVSKGRTLVGEKNPRTSLNADSVKSIRSLYAGGAKIAHIARAFGLKHSATSAICKGISWKYLDA